MTKQHAFLMNLGGMRKLLQPFLMGSFIDG